MKKITIQKIFCLISFLFIISCFIFYGGRFVKFYLESKKIETEEKNSLVKVLREKNTENKNFKSINGENYFVDDAENNYLLYSNILWRIIKINDDNSLTVISDHSLSSLAYGKNVTYLESYIYNWLNNTNKDYSGILENSLNKIETYLKKTKACLDTVDELSNNPCEKTNSDNYFTLLSVTDYLNIGSKESYLNNDEYFYLSNTNTENKVWYVDDNGKANLSTGNDIIGIKPVITIKENIDYLSGTGSKDDPYTIEKENGLFGSYVKLDNLLWRIYQVNDTEVRLVLNTYLKENNKDFKYRYSYNSSYHNDTIQGSIAYYLNHTFLNSLSYKDKIKEVKWPNGYYNETTNYDYTYALSKTIDSKIALISIGDIILNNDLSNYFTMTGSKDKGSMVYTIQENKKLYTKQIGSTLNVVPAISLDKELLTKGNGTYDSPYEME